ncbi:hypothetical protein OE88DRAFT_1640456 [Heliocybe sulcata]|uniref:Uncharacterized protein n=1 Tax=Heliocybe sulcata TaxID=5364 RepID=A0A5C3NGN2_9AGAM|nr:hypothetical protein OE88DRAFT_1640456 [Heliocybe sulcata]
MTSPRFQATQWSPDYASDYCSPYHATAGSASSSRRTVEATCSSCYRLIPCACYAWHTRIAQNYAATFWPQGHPEHKLGAVGYMSSPTCDDTHMQRQSVLSLRSDVDTPSSICSPPVYTPNPEYGYSDMPAIAGQDAQAFYDTFMQTLVQSEPQLKSQPSAAVYRDPYTSAAVQGPVRIHPSNYLPTASEVSHVSNGHPHINHCPVLTINDLSSQPLYSSQSALNTSPAVPPSLPQAQFTFSIPTSCLPLPEVRTAPLVIHQPRPTRPIALLEDMKKAKFSLTEQPCESGDLASPNSCGALRDLSQALATTSLRQIAAEQQSQFTTENEEDEFDDGEDDSSDFERYERYEEPAQSSVPPSPDSPLPLLCQPVSDDVLYQAQGLSPGWSDSTQEYSSPELCPHGVTRSRQMRDEDEDADVLSLLFGSALKRRRLNC